MEKVIIIPPREEFTPAKAGRLLGKDRQYIYSVMESGKLMWHLDYEGHRMISREALIEFATQFLDLTIDHSNPRS